MLENRMVSGAGYPKENCICEEKIKTKDSGYKDISTGTFVAKEDAFDYALERCLKGTEEDQMEFREMLVEWFYSNWIKED